ncbi:MAG TPA: DUF4349 domain-containing protein [Candidatus Limnocylindrales bacterium]|nr:DUF4349 domain-containing protein [Candidatus Limnocylindrales bacterium]
MRASRTSLFLGSTFLVALMILAGCASGGSAGLAPVGNGVGDQLSGGGQDADGGGVRASAAPSAAPAAPGEDPTQPDGVGRLVDDAKIVRTGTIELQVPDVTAALTSARDGIRAMGGYIGASQTQTLDDSPIASITYRVPVDRWEDALDLLRKLTGAGGKVLSENTNAVEVTGAVVDLEARIKNLRASEAALQEISSRATRISDVLEVQAQLTTVRGQIEQLTAQLTQLNDQAAFATLTASFSTPVVAVQVASENWEPAKVFDEASARLIDILQGLTTAGIWFAIVWVPVLLLMGAVGLIVVFVLRRLGVIRIRNRPGDAPAAG